MLVNFSNKFPVGGKRSSGPIWAKIMQLGLMNCSLKIFLKRCSKIEDKRYAIVTVHFPRKYLLGKMGNYDPISAELMQPDT